jgi:kumamolisin
VISENPDARTIKAQGTAAQMQAAFGVTLEVAGEAASRQFVTYEGPLTVPKQLDGVIVAVLGLDQRPVAKPRS